MPTIQPIKTPIINNVIPSAIIPMKGPGVVIPIKRGIREITNLTIMLGTEVIKPSMIAIPNAFSPIIEKSIKIKKYPITPIAPPLIQ